MSTVSRTRTRRLKKRLKTLLRTLRWALDHFCRGNMQIATTHMKRCSTSLVIKEMQIKTTARHHFTRTKEAGGFFLGGRVWVVFFLKKITSVGEDTEQLEPSRFAGGNVKCFSHCGNRWTVLKKLILK